MTPSIPDARPPDGPVPDEELVARVLAGAKGDFAVLMKRYNQRLYRAVRAIVREDALAEDVTQQAWLLAYRALRTWRGDAGLGAWLTRIAVNEAFNQMKSSARLVALDGGVDMPSSERSPEETASSRETVAWLERHIDALPEALRVVFVMRDVEELSTAETAAALGIEEGAVRVRLHRARQVLQGEVGLAAGGAFQFDGARCDRMVANVMRLISDLP